MAAPICRELRDAATRFPLRAQPERLPPSRPRLFGAAEFRPGAPHGGRFLLRIEDIDATRCRPEFEAAIYEDLAWLGDCWETPVRRQSEHLRDYRAALERLEAHGADLSEFREPRGDRASGCANARQHAPWPRDPDGAPLYPGRAKSLSPDERARVIAEGEPYALRLDMAKAMERAGALTWSETGAGRAARVASRCGTRGLGRRDPGAQGNADELSLSVVIDDALQGVTDVVRGQDLFWSTSVHLLLQRLLGSGAGLSSPPADRRCRRTQAREVDANHGVARIAWARCHAFGHSRDLVGLSDKLP